MSSGAEMTSDLEVRSGNETSKLVRRTRAGHLYDRFENGFAILILALIAALPAAEIVLRGVFRTGVWAGQAYLANLVFLVGFVGALVTTRRGRHLAISGLSHDPNSAFNRVAELTSAAIAGSFSTAMAFSSASLVLIGFSGADRVGVLPTRLFAVFMPFVFAVMAVRFSRGTRRPGALIGGGVAFGSFLAFPAILNILFEVMMDVPVWVFAIQDFWFAVIGVITVPLIVVVVVSAFLGTPLFVVLGSVAYLLFAHAGGAVEVVPSEGYQMLTGASIPAIPLFTIAGYFLSESKAGERLVRLFQALFGWLPGGMVVAAVISTVFFTSFTGASGVTILALGGLLYYVLHESGRHSDEFTTGILTSSSNVGLLFPPSLAMILYGTTAQINIFHMFLAGILPGFLIVIAFCAVGVLVSLRHGVKPSGFDARAAGAALKESAGEVLLPVVIITAFFSGVTTIVETGALAVVYVVVLEIIIRREISLHRVPRVMLKAITIIGGVLVILASARALSYFIIDARVPMLLSEWVQSAIASPLVFLMLLNVVLLITGCFMDIFSAILVVAPLVIPLGAAYGIAPVHLGAIFIANLGLGFITPPVGLDLFIASYRFNKSLSGMYRNVLPFFGVQLAAVLVITYVPWLSTVLVNRFGG